MPKLDLFLLTIFLCSHLFCQADVITNETSSSNTESEDDFEDYFVHRVRGFHDNDDEELREEKTEEEALADLPRAPYLDTAKWRNGWKKYPLYLIILGGFRWDFLKAHKSNLTSFIYLRKQGSAIPMVKPVFPPEDFPVWTSLATGMYPEEHNIIGDVMFDLRTRVFFERADANSTRDPDWWKGVNPFWATAAKHGRKVALFNWHDCQLAAGGAEGSRWRLPAEDCRPYRPRKTVQPRQEIARMFDEAFNRLYTKDYDIAVVYTDAIRRAAEIHGPLSKELNKVLHDIDDVLQTKLIDIISKDEKAGIKMNLMVISDYGMSDARELEPIYLDEYLDMEKIQYIILSSGYATLVPYALTHQKILADCNQIRYGVDVYSGNPLQDPPIQNTNILPSKLHYEKGEWTQDVLLVTRPGYQLVVNSTDDKIILVPGSGLLSDATKARIGFNPYPSPPVKPKIRKGIKPSQQQLDNVRSWEDYQTHKNDMNVMAFALGPDFKKNFQSYEEVEAVDFYQIFCFLLRIPAGQHRDAR